MSALKKVNFNSSGRYAVLGSLTRQISSVLIVFHGQGQLAEYFVNKFIPIADLGIPVIAPEALHHYYLKGFNGRVGASWMTSENRLESIKNYLDFLDAVLADILKQTGDKTKLHLLGFSQGTATVSRWVAQRKPFFEQLILWGGTLPPDLDPKAIHKQLSGKLFTHVLGKEDPYITPERIEEINNLIKGYKLETKIKLYDGGHDIEPGTLLEQFNFK